MTEINGTRFDAERWTALDHSCIQWHFLVLAVLAQEYNFPVGRESEVLAQIRRLKLLPTRLV